MPIVFVHGVNNRLSDGYAVNVTARDALLKRIVGPVLIPEAGANLQVFNPYWGDLGVKFAWDMAALPNSTDRLENFGGGVDPKRLTAIAAASILPIETTKTDDILSVARRDLKTAIELLFAAQMAGVRDQKQAETLADAYVKLMSYASTEQDLNWLNQPQLTAQNFIGTLQTEVTKNPAYGEAFGGGVKWTEKLKEGFDRLKGAIPDAINSVLLEKKRESVNAGVTRFAGDAFVYLVSREREGINAPIVQTVLRDLQKADEIRKTPGTLDKKLVVVSHSFGGEIMYDILTKYRIDLQVDCWITIGSQVGLFEEMKLFESSDINFPGRDQNNQPNKRTVNAWPNIERWLNVFDLNDIVSYRAEPIFAGVKDFKYDTGFTTLGAHGGYFVRPSFYERLAARLKEA